MNAIIYLFEVTKIIDLATDKALGEYPMFFMPLGYFNQAKWVAYYQFFRSNRFDTICDFNANFAGLPLLIAKLTGIRKELYFYRQGKDHFKPTAVRRLYNSIMNRSVFRYATHTG